MTAEGNHPGGVPPRPAAVERRYGFRAIGVAVSQVAAPILKKRGGLLARLKADWVHIVGEASAGVSWPTALGRDGALKLRVLSVAALELQHRAPLVVEQINLYFGRPVATRLLFVQGPLPLAPPPAPLPCAPLAAGTAEALDRRLAHILDPDLRAALMRLGRAVVAAEAEASQGPVAPESATD
jgi:hypothetical protein